MTHKFSCSRIHNTFIMALVAGVFCCGLLSGSSLAAVPPAGQARMQTQAPSGTIVLKLSAESGLMMTRQGVTPRSGAGPKMAAQAAELKALVADLVPGSPLTKRIPAAQEWPLAKARASAEPDLALYANLPTRDLTREEMLKILPRLMAHPAVQLAFLEPVAVPAALGFDAFTGETPAGTLKGGQPSPPSEDYQPQQGYLEDAPLGVGALAMRPVAGQRGAGVTVIDIEGGWLWAHEDLPDPVADLGTHIDDLGWRNHGTAVIGEIRGSDNGFGVTGITPDCLVGNSSIGGANTAAALAAAMEVLQPGDIILIELHAPGPNANGQGQFGYLPMEYWQDNFDAIRLATSRGILVCEAAGNGYQNLDDPIYQGLFNRQTRDSGAIMCGATAGSELRAADFSNNGQRVDLNGWGWYVTTCGYGDLFGLVEEEYYTAQFSGTSSASPIVTASVASLQGMVRQLVGFDLDARLARDLLRETGTPMEFGTLIGTRPNLVAAYDLAAAVVGQLSGTVTEAGTGLPLAGVQVQVSGQGSFTTTDASGSWRLPLQAGPVNLEFASFTHRTSEGQATVIAGQTTTLDLALEPRPLISIQGIVYDELLNPLEGVVLTCINQPVGGATSGPGGSFSLDGIPADHIYQLRCDGLPGYGAQVLSVDTTGLTDLALLNPILAQVSEDFETDGGGFTGQDGFWQYGAPPVEVTGGAFGGSLCWGVGMAGTYGDDEADILTSPVYDLAQVTAPTYYLSFHFYGATEAGFDGVNLEASDGSGFAILPPVGGYTDTSLGGLGNNPGWAGQTGRWRGAVFDISAFVGGSFQFRLNWGSDGGVTEQGFYIDSVAFGSGNRVTPVHDEPPVPALPVSLTAWPNPFNPRVNLAYSLPASGPLNISIFDVRGRRVRVLAERQEAPARGTLTWDGRDDANQTVSSGVYFVMVSARGYQPAVSRVVLSK